MTTISMTPKTVMETLRILRKDERITTTLSERSSTTQEEGNCRKELRRMLRKALKKVMISS
jgi:hypothetical protein